MRIHARKGPSRITRRRSSRRHWCRTNDCLLDVSPRLANYDIMRAKYGCYRFVARAFLIGDALPAASAVRYGFVPGEPSAASGAGAGLVDQGRVSWPFARLASVGPRPGPGRERAGSVSDFPARPVPGGFDEQAIPQAPYPQEQRGEPRSETERLIVIEDLGAARSNPLRTARSLPVVRPCRGRGPAQASPASHLTWVS